MGWKGIRVRGKHDGSLGRRLFFPSLHQISVVLADVIFLISGETGWGNEGRKIVVSTRESTTTHGTNHRLLVHEGKIEVSYNGHIAHQAPRMTSVADSPQRTNRSLVNTVMALLATFEEAGVLPPEGTAQANQVIHALIQIQSAAVKTSDPELQRFLEEAIRVKVGNNWEETYRSLSQTGLTSIMLEALVNYASQSAVWEQDGVAQAFRQFNVTEEDWVMVENIFLRARDVYAQQGVSIHDAFSAWLHKMP